MHIQRMSKSLGGIFQSMRCNLKSISTPNSKYKIAEIELVYKSKQVFPHVRKFAGLMMRTKY